MLKEKIKWMCLVSGVTMFVTLGVDILNIFLSSDTVLGILIFIISLGITENNLN